MSTTNVEEKSITDAERDEIVSAVGVAQAETEILTGEHKCEIPGFGKLLIKYPTLAVESKANEIYTAAFTTLFRNDTFLTIKQLTKLLEQRGIWTTEDEKKLNDLKTVIVNRQMDLAEFMRLSDKQREAAKEKEDKIRDALYTARIQFFDLAFQKAQLFENTIEKRASKESIIYKASQCVYNEDGTKLWNSAEEVLNDARPSVQKVINEFVRVCEGIDFPLYGSLLADLTGS